MDMNRIIDEYETLLTLRYSSPSFPRRLETSITLATKRRGIGQFYGTAFPFPVFTKMRSMGMGNAAIAHTT